MFNYCKIGQFTKVKPTSKFLTLWCSSVYRLMYSLLIHSFYLSIHLQSQLESIGVVNIYPKTGFSDEELKMYLATPPAGK